MVTVEVCIGYAVVRYWLRLGSMLADGEREREKKKDGECVCRGEGLVQRRGERESSFIFPIASTTDPPKGSSITLSCPIRVVGLTGSSYSHHGPFLTLVFS